MEINKITEKYLDEYRNGNDKSVKKNLKLLKTLLNINENVVYVGDVRVSKTEYNFALTEYRIIFLKANALVFNSEIHIFEYRNISNLLKANSSIKFTYDDQEYTLLDLSKKAIKQIESRIKNYYMHYAKASKTDDDEYTEDEIKTLFMSFVRENREEILEILNVHAHEVDESQETDEVEGDNDSSETVNEEPIEDFKFYSSVDEIKAEIESEVAISSEDAVEGELEVSDTSSDSPNDEGGKVVKDSEKSLKTGLYGFTTGSNVERNKLVAVAVGKYNENQVETTIFFNKDVEKIPAQFTNILSDVDPKKTLQENTEEFLELLDVDTFTVQEPNNVLGFLEKVLPEYVFTNPTVISNKVNIKEVASASDIFKTAFK